MNYKYFMNQLTRAESYNSLVESSNFALLFIGVRLEDGFNEITAFELGMERVDESTFVLPISSRKEVVDFKFEDFCTMFEAAFVFRFQNLPSLVAQGDKIRSSNYIKSSVIGPLNLHIRKSNVFSFTSKDGFFSEIGNVWLLNSMDEMILQLVKV